MNVIGNMKLKYKFWLVNIISFTGMLVILGSFVWINGIETLNATIIIVLIIMTAIIMIASQLLINYVAQPIISISESMKAVQSDGDLSIRVPVNSHDEIGAMSASFNDMQKSLHSIVKQVSEAVNAIKENSSTLHDLSNATSKGIDRQQSETQQMATETDNMVSSLENIYENVKSGENSAMKASEHAHNGEKVVMDVSDSINTLASEVSEASNQITELVRHSDDITNILDVIRSIADQTNLLALNAAIEAARAGEQGRGFAVVADEVRTLAKRTQGSTEEIQAMVSSLQESTSKAVKVMERGRLSADKSTNRANDAALALKDINQSVNNICTLNSQIYKMTEEQRASTGIIQNNMSNISHVIEDTAKGIERSNQSCENLHELAENLSEQIKHFKL